MASAAGLGAKGEDEARKAQSEQQAGKVTVTQHDWGEKDLCKFKGPKRMLNQLRLSFSR